MVEEAQRRDTNAPGQVMEFRVWTELIQQSRGALHVFLPLLDRGLDAVVHRLTDGEYIPVQVKSRSRAINGFIEITIPASELVDDRALIIAGLLTDEGLGSKLLVIDEGTFKQVASCSPVNGVDLYAASFNVDSETSHWLPFLVPRERLGERLLGAPGAGATFEWVEDLEREEIARYDRWLGFLGEAEIVRRLAENPKLDLFRPFPDLEMVEVLARNRVNARFAGFQVKTGVPAEPWGEARIAIRKATLVPSASTYVAALAWLPKERCFSDECLVIPTNDLVRIGIDDGAHLFLNFHPHSRERTALDPYRRRLTDLGQLAEESTGV